MSRKPTWKRTRPKPKAVLRLPDLDQAKSAVLNSLTSSDAQRGYRHAIEEFVEWYCSAKRFFQKVFSLPANPIPRVINVDKNSAYPAAVHALKEEGLLPRRVRLRQCKYL